MIGLSVRLHPSRMVSGKSTANFPFEGRLRGMVGKCLMYPPDGNPSHPMGLVPKLVQVYNLAQFLRINRCVGLDWHPGESGRQ